MDGCCATNWSRCHEILDRILAAKSVVGGDRDYPRVDDRVPAFTRRPVPLKKHFRSRKRTIEKTLKSLQANLAGRLPVLEGFAQPGEHALDRYQRPYYQATVQVSSTPSGGSLVRVSTKMTAWYNDPAAAHSGYQLLPSNGRLETDLLDQLADQLASNATASARNRRRSRPRSPRPNRGANRLPNRPRSAPNQSSQPRLRVLPKPRGLFPHRGVRAWPNKNAPAQKLRRNRPPTRQPAHCRPRPTAWKKLSRTRPIPRIWSPSRNRARRWSRLPA